MAVRIGSARLGENGRATGGKAGDQTGREVSEQPWYRHKKGWVVLRATDANKAQKIAQAMLAACANSNIGYDQSQNKTLWVAAQPYGFDVSKVTKPVETDCARLVRVCCAYAGIIAQDFYTGDMVSKLMATGEFIRLTDAKHCDRSDYLAVGDILVTRTKGHTVVVLTDGPRCDRGDTCPAEPGSRILSIGMRGADVREMQAGLIRMGYDLGSWGADGDFGDMTEMAVIQFQRDNRLTVDGEYGRETHAALSRALDRLDSPDATRQTVRVTNGNYYVRTEPYTGAATLGVARRGTELPYSGETAENGWYAVQFEGAAGWISGKCGTLEV